MPPRKQGQPKMVVRKALRINSKMPFGIHKGITIDALIKNNPEYLAYHYRRGYVILSPAATTRLFWELQS